jgi:hypothetical protein
MFTLTEGQIKQIADELDSGFSCFIHKVTAEIIAIPHDTSYPGMDMSAWKDDIKKVENKRKEYLVIDPLASRDSFNIMKDFTNQIENEKLRSRLISALNHRKPFSHFKFEIDNSGEYRQKWFDFKSNSLQQWVRELIMSGM